MTDPDPTDATDAENRAFARQLFAPDPDEPADAHKPPAGNFVPREGSNIPKTPVDDDQVMREFIRNLLAAD